MDDVSSEKVSSEDQGQQLSSNTDYDQVDLYPEFSLPCILPVFEQKTPTCSGSSNVTAWVM